MSLIDTLGESYCSDWFRQSLVEYEGKPFFLHTVRRSGIRLHSLISDEHHTTVPHEWLSGFSKLAYPDLGYRKFGNQAWYVTRRQGAQRGLQPRSLILEPTNATHTLMLAARSRDDDNPSIVSDPSSSPYVLAQVIVPTYDRREVLDDVLSGRAAVYVPSHALCIEPLHNSRDFGIYFHTKLAGTITSSREVDVVSPSVHKYLEKYL